MCELGEWGFGRVHEISGGFVGFSVSGWICGLLNDNHGVYIPVGILILVVPAEDSDHNKLFMVVMW